VHLRIGSLKCDFQKLLWKDRVQGSDTTEAAMKIFAGAKKDYNTESCLWRSKLTFINLL
jgi:hypothetical protein